MYKRLKYYSGFGTTVGFCYELVCDGNWNGIQFILLFEKST